MRVLPEENNMNDFLLIKTSLAKSLLIVLSLVLVLSIAAPVMAQENEIAPVGNVPAASSQALVAS
jgi:hypothetical protein